jgi:hypothetical protein
LRSSGEISTASGSGPRISRQRTAYVGIGRE